MKKSLFSLCLVGLLSVGAFGADFSKLSNESFVAAGANLAAKDVPDYKMELHKRMQSMNYFDAKALKKSVKYNFKMAKYQSTPIQQMVYKNEVCQAMQAKTDSMSGKQIRESGLKIKRNCFKG